MVIRPWFTPFIVAFWCLTTGWLVTAKILPSMMIGPPRGYQALYANDSRPIPVAWSLLWNETAFGWAMTHARRTDTGGMTVESRMRLDRLPMDNFLQGRTGSLILRMMEAATSDPETGLGAVLPGAVLPGAVLPGAVLPGAVLPGAVLPGEATPLAATTGTASGSTKTNGPADRGAATFEARGLLSINATGELETFSSTVRIPGVGDTVFLDGTIDDGKVVITIRSRGLRYETTRHLPSSIMLGDELSPQATMPGLEPGKRWTVPSYSPLRIGSSPLEVLHARVVGDESLFWEDNLVRTLVVEYHDDPTSHRRPRSRMWVDRSGRVLRHESRFFGSTLIFVRRSDEAAKALARNLDEESATP